MHVKIVNNPVYKRKPFREMPGPGTPGVAGGLRTAVVMMGGPSPPVCASVVDPFVQEWLD
jgi:hypothetical protein